MTSTEYELTDAAVARLRERFPYMPSRAWVGELARKRGWQEANTTYLNGERKRAAAAMRHLMQELGVSRVSSPEEAIDLLTIAFQVFAPDQGLLLSLERDGNQLTVESVNCPVFKALEDAGWHTVTACPSWHKRRGWLDALGVGANDTVLREMKWGDPACRCVIEIRSVA